MGNACAKNASEQVKENKPAAPGLDTSALDERERLNEALRQQKRDLEEELAKWRKQHGDRMKEVDEELEAVQAESSNLLSVGGSSGEMREAAEKLLQEEQAQADEAEVDGLRLKRDALKEHIEQLTKENAYLDDITRKTEEGAQELDELLSRLNIDLDKTDDSNLETPAAVRARNLGVIAEMYRPVMRPSNFRECIDQSRIDCAECSSQTVRNLKALAHHWATGDDSWYQTKAIRGVVCNTLRMGNVPHDPWTCELCHYIDNSDVPIFV